MAVGSGGGNTPPVTTQPGSVNRPTHKQNACMTCCLPVTKIANAGELPGSCCCGPGCCGYVGWGTVVASGVVGLVCGGAPVLCGPVVAACRSGMCQNGCKGMELDVYDDESITGETVALMPSQVGGASGSNNADGSSGSGNGDQTGGQQ